jgi:hypothetical protein
MGRAAACGSGDPQALTAYGQTGNCHSGLATGKGGQHVQRRPRGYGGAVLVRPGGYAVNQETAHGSHARQSRVVGMQAVDDLVQRSRQHSHLIAPGRSASTCE